MAEKAALLRAGLLPLGIFAAMMVPFVNGWTSLVESSAIGAMTAFLAAVLKGRMTREVFETSVRRRWASPACSCGSSWPRWALARCSTGWARSRRSRTCSPSNWACPWMILILMQLSFILMGTFLDDTAMLVIVAPLYVPLVGRWVSI